MKYSMSRASIFIAAVGVVVILTAVSPAAVQAQSTGLHVNIPFEFHVGDRVLPPGKYTLFLRSGTALTISDEKGSSAVRLTNAINRPEAKKAGESILVFVGYGTSYFLEEVRWAGYQEARSLLKSKSQIEFAKLNMPPTRAVVAVK
jgi:hypothetical protein